MGCFNINDSDEKDNRKFVMGALKKRGLHVADNEIEVHGPHGPDFNFKVFIVKVYPEDDLADMFFVAIYPRATYRINGYDQWNNVTSENKIKTRLQKRGGNGRKNPKIERRKRFHSS